MKIKLLLFVLFLQARLLNAQVPNFGTTVGNQKLYGYSSLKFRAKSNMWETYSTLQYGFSNYFQTGVDLYTGNDKSFLGYVVRTGYPFSKHFKVGAQLTPSFDLGEKHKFSYLTSALYINGNITNDGEMFYVTNTWLENDKDRLTSAKQWTYLGYNLNIGNAQSITPMVGLINSWKFDSNVDLSFGAYYTYKNINLYAWTNDILTNQPRFIIAVEFAFSNK